MDKILIEEFDYASDDAHDWEIAASRNGLKAIASGRDKARATREAIAKLKALEIKSVTPTTPNYENDLISFLCRHPEIVEIVNQA